MFSNLTPEGKRYFAELKKLERLEVQVGYWRGEKQYNDKNKTELVDVAVANELGTSTIPARPFMKQSFENHEDVLQKECDNAIDAIAKGDSALQALQKIGLSCKGLVQDEIVDGGFAPNAPSTIAKKKSERPLIDTGYMRQNVDFKIKKRK